MAVDYPQQMAELRGEYIERTHAVRTPAQVANGAGATYVANVYADARPAAGDLGGNVQRAVFIPDTAFTVATNVGFSLTLRKKNSDGTGVTTVATVTPAVGTYAAGTPIDLGVVPLQPGQTGASVYAAGQVLDLLQTQVGTTGLAIPQGLLAMRVTEY